MIVNIGKRIKVSISGFEFACDCATPGAVHVSNDRGETITLPGHPQAARAFVAAYLRTVDEPIDYVSSEFESTRTKPVLTVRLTSAQDPEV